MKRLIYSLLVAAVVPFASCVADDAGTTSARSGKLSVYVTADGVQVGLAKTRATLAPEAGEDSVNDLHLLFFQSNSSGNGVFVDHVTVEGPLSMNTQFDIDLTGTSVDIIEAYDILAIANVAGTDGARYLNGQEIDNWMQQWVGKTQREVMAQATAWATAGYAVEPSGLLMNGRVSKARSQFHLELTLSRNQARFDVLNSVKNDYDLMEAAVYNAYPSSSVWNQGTVDYTQSVGRIPMYYSYLNTNAQGDILGHLYAFENQVPMPVQNDRFTTALLVRLENKTTRVNGWYRINIAPSESAQILKRDNAYRVTLLNVGGPGFPTPQEAYDDPNLPEIDYVINYWDQNNAGVIVQDGSSILSIPSKTVRFGRDGGVSVNQIFAFTNNPNPVSPLTIVSQNFNPSNNTITATLTGNTLTINAAAMPDNEVVRTGTITLGYAGLQATVEVIQNGAADKFLQVILPNNTNIPRFAPFAGLSSDPIRVSASGDWTAEIFSDDSGSSTAFSFASPSGPAVTKISSADGSEITDNRFNIYTFSANTGTAIRDAFVVVTLDDDPENNAVVFRVSQAPAGGISLLPNQASVTFNGTGTGLAHIANNATATFNVRPSEVEQSGTTSIPAWECVFKDSGKDSWSDTSDWFEVAATSHDSDPAQNKITVSAKGQNMSNAQYTSTLRIRLIGDPNTYKDLQLVQQQASFSLQPNVVPAVAKTGGRTQDITVVGDNTLKWKASIATVSGTSSDGRRLVRHDAKLFTDSNEEVDPTKEYPMSTKFYVAFPKVFFPNRDITISASVTVTVAGSLTQTINIAQTPLTSNGFAGMNINGSTHEWGRLGNYYNQGWDAGLSAIQGWQRITPDGTLSTTSVNSAVTYLHVVPQQSGSDAANWNWAVVNDFIRNDRGFVVISQQSSDVDACNNTYSPIYKAQYNALVYGGTPHHGTINSSYSATKLYQFVMDKGKTPLTASQITENFFTDGIFTSIAGTWPSSAVVFISRNGSPDKALLIVDIEHGFMYIGESQLFWMNTTTYTSGNRGTFRDNLLQFIAYASMYGTHFTDLLLESGPNAQPAPWADEWGDNRAATANGVPAL